MLSSLVPSQCRQQQRLLHAEFGAAGGSEACRGMNAQLELYCVVTVVCIAYVMYLSRCPSAWLKPEFFSTVCWCLVCITSLLDIL